MLLEQLFERVERSIRVPDCRSIELPRAFSRLVDHPDFQRLRRVRQLGSIHLVYPGALHSRFEHSLGVFWASVTYLRGLSRLPAFRDRIDDRAIEALLAAALLHDLGHYPFAHNLEALHSRSFETPRHEDLAAAIICGEVTSSQGPALGELIEDELDVDRHRVSRMVQWGSSQKLSPIDRLLASIINSTIDADKLDYLERDSLHMGVPYGRMPDRDRMISSLTVNPRGDRIALTEKGRVAGEIFLFCRYLMFSEAYWHHTARAASAMIEAALSDYVRRESPSPGELQTLLLNSSDDQLLDTVAEAGPKGALSSQLLTGLMPNARGLYKRILTLNRQRNDLVRRKAYDVIFSLKSRELEALGGDMRQRLSPLAGIDLPVGSLLIDTPPRDKDHTESIEILFEGPDGVESLNLEEISQVVRGVATDFVKVVKKIRVFVEPGIWRRLDGKQKMIEAELLEAIFDSATEESCP